MKDATIDTPRTMTTTMRYVSVYESTGDTSEFDLPVVEGILVLPDNLSDMDEIPHNPAYLGRRWSDKGIR